MATRSANANWNGTLTEGDGTMQFGGGAFKGSYSFKSRFEDGEGTNPEELIAAAHAGCFSMAPALGLEQAGYSTKRGCPVSKALAAVGEINLDATLEA